jgi:hypothetical protein
VGHYAKVFNGLVLEVIVATKDFIDSGAAGHPSLWVKTSYNTRGGVHYEPNSNTPSADQTKALRKNFAGKNSTYDATLDAFIPPKPYASWALNEVTCLWEAPMQKPNDGQSYIWDEDSTQWVLLTEE